jgi:hypothetical protein|tara:strand:- start:61 stop:237 length:177 start_codon:yes stop_codon:yes gene_type:complete
MNKVINQLEELFADANESLCDNYFNEGYDYDDLEIVYDLLMEQYLTTYIFVVLEDFEN